MGRFYSPWGRKWEEIYPRQVWRVRGWFSIPRTRSPIPTLLRSILRMRAVKFSPNRPKPIKHMEYITKFLTLVPSIPTRPTYSHIHAKRGHESSPRVAASCWGRLMRPLCLVPRCYSASCGTTETRCPACAGSPRPSRIQPHPLSRSRHHHACHEEQTRTCTTGRHDYMHLVSA